ncbi:YafY family transcriptional regulator [Ktedonosporobacter rubrisoli]|uniref:YafY family transcriptional regulator n=1 Tax=Ktedonosporobacter rubrisoli TaxID=2509675 RepID=A0A4P6JXV0_KTERU|nr:YafY family protein [Ktedonosporobacter rubrisoli]QBD80263.1 YafY family transcriptional regulator [Ktedonosporobacter rubrisoli]
MNKTDRLLAIVLELQSKGRQRAEDLAQTFETSKRTIYRDIQALSEAGVPLISVPGQGYSLMEGYFLPPLSFSSEEATMLLLGSDFMARNFDAQYRAAAQSAGRKIAGVLPEHLRDEVHYLRESIVFITPGAPDDLDELPKLQQLRRAIIEHTTVRFTYYTRHSQTDEPSVREVDPYGLVHYLNRWMLTGYCHMRKDVRHFRLDRLEALEFLPRTFQRQPNYHVIDRSRSQGQAGDIRVRVLFDVQVARWVREARSFYMTSAEETTEGLLATLMVRHESEVQQWLLGWGSHARVLEPESLRQSLTEEARKMLQHYASNEQ